MNFISFLEQANIVHNNKYTYNNYVNTKTKVEIICEKHGKFYQLPYNHLKGQGCPNCNKITTDIFIKHLKELFQDKYDYSQTVYINKRTKVSIICREHGLFQILPNNLMKQKIGCPKCNPKHKVTIQDFIERANNIHHYIYNYSLVHFKNVTEKVSIICEKHGIYLQEVREHLRGRGCPSCKKSKGEMIISKFLSEHNIIYEEQKSFSDLKDKGLLRFDFFIPFLNTVIEYNGIQHYKPVKCWGGLEKLEDTQRRDIIKKKYCETHNIKYYVISYKENIIEILKKIVNI